jgi:hypothetical protein
LPPGAAGAQHSALLARFAGLARACSPAESERCVMNTTNGAARALHPSRGERSARVSVPGAGLERVLMN